MTWSRSLKLAKGNDDRRKVDAVKRLVSQTAKVANQTAKVANQTERLANRMVKLADPQPIVQTRASLKPIVNRMPIANRKLVVRVIDVRQKGAAHRKETDVVRVAMPLVVRPMDVVQAMVNGAVSCRGSLNYSTATTMAGSAAMN